MQIFEVQEVKSRERMGIPEHSVFLKACRQHMALWCLRQLVTPVLAYGSSHKCLVAQLFSCPYQISEGVLAISEFSFPGR
jgi:hypothetical protein